MLGLREALAVADAVGLIDAGFRAQRHANRVRVQPARAALLREGARGDDNQAALRLAAYTKLYELERELARRARP